MISRSGPKKPSARPSACMRWPSRQITVSEIAGAPAFAAIARARSASTRPSAPSATSDSVRTLPACRELAGDFIARSLRRAGDAVEAAQAPEQGGINLSGRRLGAVHPGEHLLIGHIEPSLQFVHFDVGQRGKLRVRKAPQHEVHLADAAM